PVGLNDSAVTGLLWATCLCRSLPSFGCQMTTWRESVPAATRALPVLTEMLVRLPAGDTPCQVAAAVVRLNSLAFLPETAAALAPSGVSVKAVTPASKAGMVLSATGGWVQNDSTPSWPVV